MNGYQKIIHESEIELQTQSTHRAQENWAHIEPSASTHGRQPGQQCGSEREPPTTGPNDPIKL